MKTQKRLMRPIHLSLAAIGILVLAISLFLSRPGTEENEPLRPETVSATESPIASQSSNVPPAKSNNGSPVYGKEFSEALIEGGIEVPAATINTILNQCRCPVLPSLGPMSPRNLAAAWTTADGEVALEYASGLELYFVPDTRTEDEFIDEELEDFADPSFPLPGEIIELRNTRASALEARPAGPAMLSWREGGVYLDLYGGGGQTRSELVTLAETLVPPQ